MLMCTVTVACAGVSMLVIGQSLYRRYSHPESPAGIALGLMGVSSLAIAVLLALGGK